MRKRVADERNLLPVFAIRRKKSGDEFLAFWDVL